MDIRNPNKKHSQKRDNRGDGKPLTDVMVRGIVQEGSHAPLVQVKVGASVGSMPVTDGLEMAATMFQTAVTCFNDSILVRWFETLAGGNKLQAWQMLCSFQQFRNDVIAQAIAMNQAAGAPPVSPPLEPEQPGGDPGGDEAA